MQNVVVNLLCRAFDKASCRALKELVLSKLLPLAQAAEVSLEILETYLPYLEGEEPIELPSVRVLKGAGAYGDEEVQPIGSVGRVQEEALDAICL